MKKPILIVVAGPNGSGKTSITQQILKHQWVDNCVYVNPDNIAKDIFGDWNSPGAVLKAVKYASKLREECLEQNKGLIFETVLSADDKLHFIQKAKVKGYFVRIFFVCTESPIINAARIAQRVMEGGHDVPIHKVISRYSKSIANCCIATKIADRTYLFDNSVDFAQPRLLFRVSDGRIAKEYADINSWALSIRDFLQNE